MTHKLTPEFMSLVRRHLKPDILLEDAQDIAHKIMRRIPEDAGRNPAFNLEAFISDYLKPEAPAPSPAPVPTPAPIAEKISIKDTHKESAKPQRKPRLKDYIDTIRLTIERTGFRPSCGHNVLIEHGPFKKQLTWPAFERRLEKHFGTRLGKFIDSLEESGQVPKVGFEKTRGGKFADRRFRSLDNN